MVGTQRTGAVLEALRARRERVVGGLAGQVIPKAEVATQPAHQGAPAGENKPTDVIW